MEKSDTSKTLLKMAGVRMRRPTPHFSSLDPPLVITYGNHQKSLVDLYISQSLGAIIFVLFHYRA